MEAVKEAIKAGATDEELNDQFFEVMVKYGRGIKEAKAMLAPKEFKGHYKLDDFKDFGWEPVPQETLRSKTIIFSGKPGIGKTQFALAHFKNPFLCTNTNMLNLFNPKVHDGIVFDDVALNTFARETRIQYLDLAMDRYVRILYGVALIPKNTPRIFTTNSSPRTFLFKPEENYKDGALLRRCFPVKLDRDLEEDEREYESLDWD